MLGLLAGATWAFGAGFSFWPTRERENLMNLGGVLLLLALGVFVTLVVWWPVLWVRKTAAKRNGHLVPVES